MLIKRNVYFSAIDQETGEEKLFSVNEVLDEETYLEKLYSKKEDDTKLKIGDRMNIWANKHLATKGDREAMIESTEKGKHGKMVKRAAISAGIGGAIGGGAGTKILGGSNKMALATAGIYGAAAAAGGAAGSYIGAKGRDFLRKHSKSYDKKIEKQKDAIKVANGDMSKAEFAKKHYKKED